MSKKPRERFQKYAQRWLEMTSQVQAPLTDKEMTIFISTLLPTYYVRLYRPYQSVVCQSCSDRKNNQRWVKKGKLKIIRHLFEHASSSSDASKRALPNTKIEMNEKGCSSFHDKYLRKRLFLTNLSTDCQLMPRNTSTYRKRTPLLESISEGFSQLKKR